MILDPTTAIVGTIAFALHVYGKYKENPVKQPFFPWLFSSLDYVIPSLGLCIVGVLLRHEIMEPLGFSKEGTFVFVLCYGAGHAVSRLLGMKQASDARKA